jgi:MAF protein
MAEIRPLKAWRYNKQLSRNIEELTSPLFDVVSEKHRRSLYKHPYNSIHLSVPLKDIGAEGAARMLQEWKEKGILAQDKVPGIYVYYQYFSLPGSSKEYCRKGFICDIKAYDWDEKVILRHENTIPKAVNDRIELLDKTQLNVSATHGLYSDPGFQLEAYMDECIRKPLYETEDYQGVRDVMGIIQDPEIVQQFLTVIRDKQIILADGHHRYEGSLVYRKKRMEENPNHTGNEAYNFHLMYLTNMDSDHLRILPTHRLIQGLENFSPEEILKKLEKDFIIKEVENAFELNEIILGKIWAFGLLFKDSAFKIRLKPEIFQQMPWQFPDEVRRLDLTVMHYFVIERVLGIPGKEQRHSEHIEFDRSFTDCLTKVMMGESQMALITKDISMEEVKKVCFSGYTMPQKSTYFYPKVICGFLFNSIKEEENKRSIILASGSPRRQQLLRETGLDFMIRTKDTPEDFPMDMRPEKVAAFLAEKKALAFQEDLNDEIVITADTVVIVDGQILGKPVDAQEAEKMLQMLSGRKHEVITGVCILSKEKKIVFDDTTKVHFKKLKEQDILYYINTYHPFDKAGAYGIQEWIGLTGIEKIEGSYFTVMGLPVHKVYEHLQELL